MTMPPTPNSGTIKYQLLRMSLLSTVAALLFAGVAFIAYDATTFEQALAARMMAFADIVGTNSASAILFNDARSVDTTLAALRMRPGLVATGIYTAKGDLFAHWTQSSLPHFHFPPVPASDHDVLQYRFRTVAVFHPIVVDHARVGSVYLLSDLSERDDRFWRYIVIVLVVMVLSILAAGLVSLQLGQRISKPILDLVEVARRISDEKEYGLRAHVTGNGEISRLEYALNEMLSQIQQRDTALQHAHDELERKVQQRTDELKRKEEELHQSQRLESVGRLAGGVAHDFNNLLTGIIGCIETLEMELPASSELSIEVSEIRRAAERASALTRQLLAFGRKQIISPQLIDLNQLVQTTGKLIQRLIGEDVRLTLELSPTLSRIQADSGQIDQVLVNLAVNSRDAMPDGGKLVIKTTDVTLAENAAALQLVPGEYVCLSVEDTGTGMTDHVKAQIFEPFFTTKEVGKGTGLGLATVYGIVKQNRGSIRVQSVLGQGTTFMIFFPSQKARARPEAEGPTMTKPIETHDGHERILLVEDDPLVSSHVSRLLRRRGYDVLLASNGPQGLDLLRQQKQPVDLLVTDVIMPEMNGRQLVEEIRKDYPELQVLYMSGYPAEIIAKHGMVDPGIFFIQKPFRSDDICQRIREIIDRKGSVHPAS